MNKLIIVRNSQHPKRQVIKGIGTYLYGACDEWRLSFFDFTTRADTEKYVGTHAREHGIYQYGGALEKFVCNARGQKVPPTDSRAHLALGIEEWEGILAEGVKHIEFIAFDVRHCFVISVERAAAIGHEYMTMNGKRWLIPLYGFDETGIDGRVLKPRIQMIAQPALL